MFSLLFSPLFKSETANAFSCITLSQPALVEHLELNQLNGHSAAALHLYTSVHTLICNDVQFLSFDLQDFLRENDPLARPPIIDQLNQLPMLTQLHLWDGPFYGIDLATLDYTRHLLLTINDRISQLAANRGNELTIFILGIPRTQVFAQNGIRETGDSIEMLHFRNRTALANSFPSCSFLRIDSQLIHRLRPAQSSQERLHIPNTYPGIESVVVNDPDLIFQVLFRLIGIREKHRMISRLIRFFETV